MFEILSKSNLKFDPDSVSSIQAEVEVLQGLSNELSELPKIEGLEFTELSVDTLKRQLATINPAMEWVSRWKEREDFHALADWKLSDFRNQLSDIAEFSRSFSTQKTNWKAYLSDVQILEILQNGFLANQLEFHLNQTFSELVAFDRF